MGKRGPKPLSHEQLAARGSWRAKLRQPTPSVDIGAIDPPRKAPRTLGKRGRQFWRDVAEIYELSVTDYVILQHICDDLDRIDECHDIIQRDGRILIGPRGGMRIHPAVRIELQTQRAFLQGLKALGLDDRHPIQRPEPERQTPPHGNSTASKLRFLRTNDSM